MVAEVVDYRVSRLVVLCKDCGHDVGLYPARHKCKISDANAPPLPSMPKQYLSSNKPNSSNDDNNPQSSSLWSKLKNVNNWKEMAEDDSVKPDVSQSTTSAKLWDKLLSAASSAYGTIDDNSDNESEKDDWEGETHISRILREYHQQKSGDIPDWLYDPKPILPQSDSTKNKNNIPPPNRIPAEGYKNSLPNNSTSYQSNDNNNRGRKPRTYDENDALLTKNSSTNFNNRNRNVNNSSSRLNNFDDQRNLGLPPFPNNYDQRMYNDRPPTNYDSRFYNNNRPPNNYNSGMHNDRHNDDRYNKVFGDDNNDKNNDRVNMYHQRGNHVPQRLYPPSDDVVKLSSKKSQQLLRVNPTENSFFNRARSVSPNPFRNRNANQPNKQSKGYKKGYF
ncbi:hypothetical protein F8M41_019908 [Gigaspora margarita]|uniref:Mso1 N-terminal domain-containing protein n=1 Tax=Gigaspora margarita TaxID=4874 RepID=A0A8H4B227_GIGMA|nr:hypothetical protein F8M41_019908 [Gigaspora margarita]